MPKLMYTHLYQIKEGNLPIDWKRNLTIYLSQSAKMLQEIIIEKPRVKGGKVKEFLTGVEFDSMYYGNFFYLDLSSKEGFDIETKYRSKNRCIDTCVTLSQRFGDYDGPCYRKASLEEIKRYVEKHKDIEAYKEYLEAIKLRGEQIAKESIIEDSKKRFEEEQENVKIKSLIKDIINSRRI